jgi:hypothetical protein
MAERAQRGESLFHPADPRVTRPIGRDCVPGLIVADGGRRHVIRDGSRYCLPLPAGRVA